MISILMPYYNRGVQFNTTLISFEHHYKPDEYELLVCEDSKNAEDETMHKEFLDVISGHPNINTRLFEDPAPGTWSPGLKFNFLVKKAAGDTFVITNPETTHMGNVLKYVQENICDNKYLVFSCLYVALNGVPKTFEEIKYIEKEWYQHSIYSPRCINFCTAITRALWNMVGGFDEIYGDAIAWEDNDFIRMVEGVPGVEVVQVDDVLTVHLDHSRVYNNTHEQRMEQYFRNEKRYADKWGDNKIRPFK
jgi:hypothetical protein